MKTTSDDNATPLRRRLVSAALVGSLLLTGFAAAGCGDDEGEDEIGDEEIIDEGD